MSQPSDYPIVAVTVYNDRARVTRRGRIHLAVGILTLTLENLPPTLEADSVRASGRGANAEIIGVEVATRYVPVAPETTRAELEKQLETLQDTDKTFADDESAQNARLEFLKTLRTEGGTNLAKGIAFGRANLDNVDAFAQYVAHELDTALARRRELGIQRRNLAREIQAVQARLNQLSVETRERRAK